MTSLVERLRNISRGDHERGCQGRECVCSCDYDETSWKTAEEAADEIERLRAALREFNCPRPANDRPDDFEVGQCVDAGECGCGARFALTGEPVPGGIPLEDEP